MENHCTSVNFPLVSLRTGRMAARFLEYALRVRKRIQKRERERERERAIERVVDKRERNAMLSHPVFTNTHARATHTRVFRENVLWENSIGRSICMLVFSWSLLGYSLHSNSVCLFAMRSSNNQKKFLTTTSPLRFATKSLFQYSVNEAAFRYYSRLIKASVRILIGLSPSKLNPFHVN